MFDMQVVKLSYLRCGDGREPFRGGETRQWADIANIISPSF